MFEGELEQDQDEQTLRERSGIQGRQLHFTTVSSWLQQREVRQGRDVGFLIDLSARRWCEIGEAR